MWWKKRVTNKPTNLLENPGGSRRLDDETAREGKWVEGISTHHWGRGKFPGNHLSPFFELPFFFVRFDGWFRNPKVKQMLDGAETLVNDGINNLHLNWWTPGFSKPSSVVSLFCWWGESSNKADGGQDFGFDCQPRRLRWSNFSRDQKHGQTARVWEGKIHYFRENPCWLKYLARLRKTPAQSLIFRSHSANIAPEKLPSQ